MKPRLGALLSSDDLRVERRANGDASSVDASSVMAGVMGLLADQGVGMGWRPVTGIVLVEGREPLWPAIATGGCMARESRTDETAWVGDGGTMEQLLQFEAGGGTVFVEVADDEPGIDRAARIDDMVVKASESLETALEQVRVVASTAIAKLGDLDRQPEQVEVEFGIRLNAEAGAVIARTQAEGHLQVKLAWNRSRAGAAAAAT